MGQERLCVVADVPFFVERIFLSSLASFFLMSSRKDSSVAVRVKLPTEQFPCHTQRLKGLVDRKPLQGYLVFCNYTASVDWSLGKQFDLSC